MPGELVQVLPSPKHFEQATELVTEDIDPRVVVCGHDVDGHVEAFRPYADAGFDDVHISQMGGNEPKTSAAGFFEFYGDQVLPRLREIA